jgi:sulfate adenylyltransferase
VAQQFTGISDPYEIPTDSDVVIDTTEIAAEKAAEKVFAYLEREGFVSIGQNSAAPSRK